MALVLTVVFASFGGKLTALAILAALVLGPNSWSLRDRAPWFGSLDKRRQIAAWAALATVAAVGFMSASPARAASPAAGIASAPNAQVVAAQPMADTSAGPTTTAPIVATARPDHTAREATIAEHIEAARDYLAVSQLGLAMVEADQALALDPSSGASLALIRDIERDGQVAEHTASAADYRAAGQLGLAIVEANKALALDPRSADSRALVADLRVAEAAKIQAVRDAEAAMAAQRQAGQAAVRAYANMIESPIQKAGTGLTSMTSVAARAANEPALITTAAWQREAAAAASSTQSAGRALQARRSVPVGAEQMDRLLVSIGGDLVAVGDDFAYWAAYLDTVRLLRAATRLDSLNPKLIQVTAEVNALRRAYGL